MSRRGRGSFSERRDGLWQGSVQVDGRRLTVYGKSKPEAEAKLQRLARDLLEPAAEPGPWGGGNGSQPAGEGGERTVGDLFHRWLEARRGDLKPSTLYVYRLVAALIVSGLGARTPLAEVCRDTERLQRLYQRGGRSPRMAQMTHQILKRAMRVAVLWGWIPGDPTDRVLAPRHQAARKRLWSEAEMATFLAGAGRWRPLWLLLAAAGLRVGEARALKWSDLDWQRGLLHVQRGVDRDNVVATPKTPTSVRSVQLPPQVLEALRHWRERQAAEMKRLGKQTVDDTPGLG